MSNTDDHLRNHAFLHDSKGWRLSPAYDMNPMPTDVRPRIHALAIDATEQTASLETALKVAPFFHLKPNDAKAIVRAVARSVTGWRNTAAKVGLTAADIARMASAFEHDDLATACVL